jgi:hypothetical protein
MLYDVSEARTDEFNIESLGPFSRGYFGKESVQFKTETCIYE